jgi:predicted outer membrane repeat protein
MIFRHTVCAALVASISLCFRADAATAASDAVIGNGTPASCTEAALNAALSAGGSLTFQCGPNPHTITFTTPKTISADTVIDGGGKLTFDGGAAVGHFFVNGTSLTLKGVRLVNAATNASVQLSGGALTVADSTFQGNARFAIANLTSTSVMTITRSAFVQNQSTGFGGAIYNSGRLDISNSTFLSNTAPVSYEGGAIYNAATAATRGHVTIRRSTFVDNNAGYGGAISNSGDITLTESVLAGNVSTFNGGSGGGALIQSTGGRLIMTNVTVSGGRTQNNNRGSALYVNGQTTLTNVTIADNTGGAGQVYVATVGTLALRNTIIANGACGKDASATVTDNTGNFAFNAAGCPGTNADPQLLPLAYYGGPTQTRALPNTSPARDAGTNTGCPGVDQRGVLRPQQVCDSGAFEHNSTPVFNTVNPATACTGSGDTQFTFTGTNFIDGPFGSEVVLNGSALATRYVGPTQLTAVVPAAALAAPAHTLTFMLRVPIPDVGTTGVSAAAQQVEVKVCNEAIAGLTAGNDGPTLLGSTTQLTASISAGSGVSFIWDFGDGQIGAGQSPTHTYGAIGSYVATVTATNNTNSAVARTVVNVNLVTTGKLVSTLRSKYGAVITYTFVVTHIAPPGSPAASVTLTGAIPQNAVLVNAVNSTLVASGGDYGNGYVTSPPNISLQPGQSATIVWSVRKAVPLGDVITQAHANTDDGRLQVFERDIVFRTLFMLVCQTCRSP